MGPLPGGTSFPEDVAPFLGRKLSKSGARKDDWYALMAQSTALASWNEDGSEQTLSSGVVDLNGK